MGPVALPRRCGAQLSPLSPNHGARRGGALPDLIVLHYTGMATHAEAVARLCDPVAEVSAHYVISEQGDVVQLVPEEDRAWHAGAGYWGGVTDINSRSIGIELSNPGNAPFAARQMAALEVLLAEVMTRWPIPPERVIGHSDMAPLRKVDPGRRFDWRRLALEGLSVWPEARSADVDPAMFRVDLTGFGYDPNLTDEVLLAAFRLRFRPRADGPLSAADCVAAHDLAKRFPCTFA